METRSLLGRRAQCGMASALRHAATAVVIFAALFYLQFGLQAWVHHRLQAGSVLVGALVLGWAAQRRITHRPAAAVALLGGLPALIVHAGMTIQDRNEANFLAGSVPVPLVAAIILSARWIRRSRQSSTALTPAA